MAFDERYKGLTIQGSTFPGAPYKKVKISFTKEMINEYLPTIANVMKDDPRGFRFLLIIMANKEGFYKGTRSYNTNNPGNIGNTDLGANKKLPDLASGILAQKNYVNGVISGKHSSYPMNRTVTIPPYYSPEIAKNAANYGMSPWLPGYKFTFTGQLDQFVKIYSTGARGGNSYLNMIVSYFANNGITITPQSKLQDIILIE